MSVLENMQCLVSSAKPRLLQACKSIEALFPKLGSIHYALTTQDRELQVRFLASYQEISHFSMSFYPGCREVMIFHRVVVAPELRGLGIGAKLHAARLAIAKDAGVKLVTCTVLSGNSPEKSIIYKFGWRIQTNINPMVEMWYREL